MQARHPSAIHRVIPVLVLALLVAGCSGPTDAPAQPPATAAASIQNTPETAPTPADEVPSANPTAAPASTSAPEAVSIEEGLLFTDDFTTLEGGWPAQEFDNSYFGYHEPEWYHVEIRAQNDDELVTLPDKLFEDFTMEAEASVFENLTLPEGNFRYGLVFRRAGNQWYSFVISPRTGTWAVLKRSPTELLTLKEGQTDMIQGLEGPDLLRVDAKGPTFFFHVNGQALGEVIDADYASGEIGFFVQTADSNQVHVHYDSLKIREVETPEIHPENVLYAEDFTTLEGGWPALELDNSYFGYHEPEWYHVEIRAQNDDELVTLPDKLFDDFTMEAEASVFENLTLPEGDFRYGLVFRRAGNQWYGFVISPRSGAWAVLKRSPTELVTLKEGQTDVIQGLEGPDLLRVDVKGSIFFFQVNGQALGVVSDADYASGEIGFFVQTADSAQVHVHYDSLMVREVEAPPLECQVTTTALNLRRLPDTSSPVIISLVQGEIFEPLGRNPDGSWIRARMQESDELGWAVNEPAFVSCSIPTMDLPVIEP